MRSNSSPSDRRRGGALLIAIIAMVSVSAIALGVLRVSGGTTSRLNASVDGKKAFYVAEAGIAEAYRGLAGGTTGQIGSMEAPALFGGGLVWVDATERPDGKISLKSTALYGSGRESLEVLVEPIEVLLGIFSDQDLIVDQPLLLDGYDSSAGSYEDQVVRMPSVYVRQAQDDFNLHSKEIVFETDEAWYDLKDPTSSEKASAGKNDEEFEYYNVFQKADNPDFDDKKKARRYFDSLADDSGTGADVSSDSAHTSELGQTTGGGGLMGSNGTVILGSWDAVQVELYGDVQPGPDGLVEVGSNTTLRGEVQPHSSLIELPPVEWPNIELLPAMIQDSPTPVTIPPSSLGFESVIVAAGSELWITGPSTLVIGMLELRPGASLILDNTDGPVDLIVLNGAQLMPGSFLSVASRDPGDLSLQVAGSGEVDLSSNSQFYGIIYAPVATVTVSSRFEIYGALVASSLDLAANVRIHYDSGYQARNSLPKLLSWRIDEVPTAIAQTRIDPFVLLQIDKAQLGSITDSQKTDSWFIEVEYLDVNGDEVSYEGPVEDLPIRDIQDIYEFEFEPPSAEGVGEWLIDLEYDCDRGHFHSYSGSIALQNINDHPTYFTKLITTPPADL